MRIRIGCRFDYEATGPTPAVWQVRPRIDGPHDVVASRWYTSPFVPARSYMDSFGNVCDRLTLPEGRSVVTYDALVEVPATFDDADKEAGETPVDQLPDDTLVYLLPSRFCLSDVVYDRAWELFGAAPDGWDRVQAVCNWTNEHIGYEMGSSDSLTTAVDVLESGAGVCRDLTHVGITFLRALNIPARYVSGYLPDIAVPPADVPMDFCSWLEAYLDGRWWTFDPRNNVPRMGRVVIGRGRDALDVAMATTYGAPVLRAMEVWADEVDPDATHLTEREGGQA
ncbi:MAG TPA: transglutaminase family protein [Acidimicrobiales bacterium]|nr:transglutaminase family protein [Acidimicrobiales bacterium]